MGESPPVSSVTEETTEYAVFAGMFGRALRVEPESALGNALREIGFDLRSPKARYPLSVWSAALDVATMHHCPDLPREQGYRQMGRLFIDGFFETMMGKMMSSTIPWLGIDRILAQIPRLAKMTTSGLSVEVERAGERCWQLHYRGRGTSPHFTAGVIEGGLARTKIPISVEVQAQSPEGFRLLVTQPG